MVAVYIFGPRRLGMGGVVVVVVVVVVAVVVVVVVAVAAAAAAAVAAVVVVVVVAPPPWRQLHIWQPPGDDADGDDGHGFRTRVVLRRCLGRL